MVTQSRGIIGGPMQCEICKATIIKRAVMQRYCETCSIRRSQERHAIASLKWARANPRPPGPASPEALAKSRERYARLSEAAAETNPGIGFVSWSPNDVGLDLAWIVRVKVPFSYLLSKNGFHLRAKTGHVVVRKQAKAAQNQVRDAIHGAIKRAGITPVEAKVYIDIFVQKPNSRGDAVNVVDSVCDAVKKAIGVDDRWFCIRGLDWEVVRNDPMVFIGVGQVELEHHIVCSYCGRIRTLDAYTRNRSARHGRSRVCMDCRAIERAE